MAGDRVRIEIPLSKWRERDLERGATSQGPHRADLSPDEG